ncbi:MAG: hypothetical protein DA329_02550 [Candidatus Nitrosocosmicus sp.]|jgi:plastocyanin|nr:hypothetical protein [Candidatus Nitrosocosmicus sp.]
MMKITIINASATLLAFSIFVIFGTSFLGEVSAISSNASAGGDGASSDNFSPQNITINTGERITWTNPMKVTEPHTVTFVKDKEKSPPLIVPFSISNETKLTAAISSVNVEPTIILDSSNLSNKLVIVDNLRASAPVVIDGTETNIIHLPPNSNYSFSGDESYVNSGWIFSMELISLGAPPISSFTVTFENPVTYNYICVLHPWMSGIVNVK